MKWLLIGFVKMWRKFVSPMYGQCCKYYPSCSEYGLEALELHGAIKGSALAIWRILRCNPWSMGGADPVPGSPLEAKMAAWGRENENKDSRVTVPGTSAARAVMG